MVARNGFLTKFYIEMMIQFFSQLYFFRWKKNNFEKNKMKKISKISMKKIVFSIFLRFLKILKIFFEKKKFSFSKLFFSTKKIKLRKKLDHHFDVEFCQESISGNYKRNGAFPCSENEHFKNPSKRYTFLHPSCSPYISRWAERFENSWRSDGLWLYWELLFCGRKDGHPGMKA